MTPLGAAVDPEVNWMSAGASLMTGLPGTRAGPRESASIVRIWHSPTRSISSALEVSSAATSLVVRMADARLAASRYFVCSWNVLMSPACAGGQSGTGVRPAAACRRIRAMKPETSGTSSATRSPGSRPSSRRPPAIRSDSSRSTW